MDVRTRLQPRGSGCIRSLELASKPATLMSVRLVRLELLETDDRRKRVGQV